MSCQLCAIEDFDKRQKIFNESGYLYPQTRVSSLKDSSVRVFFKEKKTFLGGFFTFTQLHNFLHSFTFSWVLLGVDNDGDDE